jgi:hypothetical protein
MVLIAKAEAYNANGCVEQSKALVGAAISERGKKQVCQSLEMRKNHQKWPTMVVGQRSNGKSRSPRVAI